MEMNKTYNPSGYTPVYDKVKVSSLDIIVTGKKEKPYYEIKYKEIGTNDYTIGYSSYNLDNVYRWRDTCFEVITSKRRILKEYILYHLKKRRGY